MRWFWLDRFSEFVSGSHATGVKCITLSEEHLNEHWPSYPVMPNTLIAEGMAQCSGLLVSEIYKFSELVVLAKKLGQLGVAGQRRAIRSRAGRRSVEKRGELRLAIGVVRRGGLVVRR